MPEHLYHKAGRTYRRPLRLPIVSRSDEAQPLSGYIIAVIGTLVMGVLAAILISNLATIEADKLVTGVVYRSAKK